MKFVNITKKVKKKKNLAKHGKCFPTKLVGKHFHQFEGIWAGESSCGKIFSREIIDYQTSQNGENGNYFPSSRQNNGYQT